MRVPWSASWVLLLMVVGTLALGAALAQPTEGPHVSDPAGDAYETNSDTAIAVTRNTCALGHTGTACRVVRDETDGELQRHEPVGVVAAPPSLDVLAGWFEETPTELLVHVQVASLDESWEGIAAEETETGPRAGGLFAAWRQDGPRNCWLAVWLNDRDAALERWDDRCLVEDPASHPWGGGCNAWWWCTYEVSSEVVYGSPATVTWRIPRALLPKGEAGDALLDPYIGSSRTEGGHAVRYDVDAIGTDVIGGQARSAYSYDVDESAPGRAFTFALDRATPASSPSTPHVPSVEMWPVDDPRLDILSIDVLETAETIGLAVEMATVEAAPNGVWFWGAIGLPDGTVVDLWIETGSGQRVGIATMATPYYDGTGVQILVPLTIEVEPGSPGMLRLLLDRAELPFIPAGGHTTLLVGGVGTEDGFVRLRPSEASPVLEPRVRFDGFTDAGHWEYTDGMTPYTFQLDTPRALLDDVLRVEDERGDARVPAQAALDARAADRLDITYLEVRPAAEDVTRLTMGVRDLSSVRVPPGFQALFYAFGVETEGGPSMVGYYKDANEPGGTFLCAQDTAVLVEARRDPTQAVWTLIEGLVNVAGGGPDSNGGGGPGSLTFFVPHACLGESLEEPLTFRRFEAATFLVQNLAGRSGEGTLFLADTAAAEGPVGVPAFVEPTETTSWYASPFGVANFWDITGILLAGAIGVSGAAVKLRRRRISSAALADSKAREGREVYREALERVVRSRPEADAASDDVLVALRERFSISGREHAVMELDVRAAQGLASGLSAGAVFLGKYRIVRPLGEGGFSHAFLARDEKLDRNVVLKIARTSSAEEARRALREGRTIAALDHPNIVAIHDLEEVGGELVLVLEHMHASLADVAAGSALGAERALAITDDVLAGLEAAHARGVVHRDVKPANILLTREGRAKLGDFGIASTPRGMATVSGGTLDGAGAGTVQYMAPEQARGLEAVPASDLYAAGAVLYELLAGEPYLDVEGLGAFDARQAVLEEQPLLPLPGVPDAVNAVLAAALSKDVAARPESAGAMRAQLRASVT